MHLERRQISGRLWEDNENRQVSGKRAERCFWEEGKKAGFWPEERELRHLQEKMLMTSGMTTKYSCMSRSTRPLRSQEQCENRGDRAGFPVPNSPYGLGGRNATLNLNVRFKPLALVLSLIHI